MWRVKNFDFKKIFVVIGCEKFSLAFLGLGGNKRNS